MVTRNSVNTYTVPTTANEVTMPAQPAFLGVLSGTDSNVTGNGAAYTVGTNTAFTEIFDQNADFNVNGTFTAPVTGRYMLVVNIQMDNVAAGMTTGVFDIVTSNRTYNVLNLNPLVMIDASTNDLALESNAIADMDTADTAYCSITISGGVGNTVDLETAGTFFCGKLIC